MTPDTHKHHRAPVRRRLPRLAATVAIASVAAVTLAACGSSGKSAPSTVTTSAGTQSASRSGRFASLRTCLQKQGINLPSAPSGGQSGTGGPPGAAGGGFKLPEGVSQSQFQEALKKCGGNFRGGPGGGFNSATARAGLTKYASCMRENGVNLPAPNTSGKGPVFDTKGIDRSSTTFKNAQAKCNSDLRGAFGGGRPPGNGEGGPPGGGEGGPPGGGEGGPPAGAPGGEGSGA
jgi:hypothetical protein